MVTKAITVELRDFMPVVTVEAASIIVMALIVVGLVYRYKQWVKVVPTNLLADARRHLGLGGLLGIFFSELVDRVALQKDVVTDSRLRWLTHFMVFWGFVGLAFATSWVFLFYGDGSTRPPSDLGKIVGNVGGVLVLVGTSVMLLRYAFVGKYRGGRRGDIVFLVLICLATLTGFTTEIARVLEAEFLAYTNYAVHLLFVIGLLVTAPFTHFFHALLVPLARCVDRAHVALMSKGFRTTLDYRKLSMAELSEYVSSGKAPAAYPDWLRPIGKKK